jgi:hypothetical protein
MCMVVGGRGTYGRIKERLGLIGLGMAGPDFYGLLVPIFTDSSTVVAYTTLLDLEYETHLMQLCMSLIVCMIVSL